MRLFIASILLAASACSGNTVALDNCTSDDQCTLPGTRCDAASKRCVCKTSEACENGFFCNTSGVCQLQTGCVENADCASEPGTFCDLQTGICLPGPAIQATNACGLATHCAPGFVCRGVACAPGCFDDGDCALGDACIDGSCDSRENVCSVDEFCGYRERCVNNECKTDRRGPYCRGCSQPTALNPTPCDDARNFCLVNSLESGGFAQFCGVDCALGQPCPNGYQCNGVVILTRDTCFNTATCQCSRPPVFATATCTVAVACDPRKPNGDPDTTAPGCTYEGHPNCNGGTAGGPATCFVGRGVTNGSCTCAADTDCAAGAVCTSGLCCGGTVTSDRECAFGENRVSGFCTCATDDDCPRDSCDGSRGTCAISGKPCTTGGNECGAIACVDGGCLIGQNCAPLEGLACSVVGGGR